MLEIAIAIKLKINPFYTFLPVQQNNSNIINRISIYKRPINTYFIWVPITFSLLYRNHIPFATILALIFKPNLLNIIYNNEIIIEIQ